MTITGALTNGNTASAVMTCQFADPCIVADVVNYVAPTIATITYHLYDAATVVALPAFTASYGTSECGDWTYTILDTSTNAAPDPSIFSLDYSSGTPVISIYSTSSTAAKTYTFKYSGY